MTDEIKDGVYASVSGTVGRVADGRFTLEVKNERAKYPDYVTVWSKEIFAQQGDRMSVKGWLSWKKSDVNGKTYVDVSVNQPKVEKHEKASSSAPVYDDPNTPF